MVVLARLAGSGILIGDALAGWMSQSEQTGGLMTTAKKLGLNVFVPKPHAHWTPSYLVNRVRQEWWFRSHPEDPWLTRTAVAFLHEYLRSGDTVVEFGSGRSTLWFARHVGTQGKVISVEASAEWQQEVSRRLVAAGLTHASVEHAVPQPVEYVQSASRRLNGKADVILIDGAVRDACAVWALTVVKPGGVIVIDNVQRHLPHASRCPLAIPAEGAPETAVWTEFHLHTASWRRFWTTDGVNDTAFFFAPVGG